MSGGWVHPNRVPLPPDWHKRRALVRKRSNGRCEHVDETTGARCPNRADGGVDHVIPRWMGGSHDLENLRDLCTPHHEAKTNAERPKKPPRTRPSRPHPGSL